MWCKAESPVNLWQDMHLLLNKEDADHTQDQSKKNNPFQKFIHDEDHLHNTSFNVMNREAYEKIMIIR